MKKEPLADKVKIAHNDYMRAWEAWNQLYNGNPYCISPNYFQNFLGEENPPRFMASLNAPAICFVSQRAADKVAMLCSPHARTLMQAFIIRTGYHKKLPK